MIKIRFIYVICYMTLGHAQAQYTAPREKYGDRQRGWAQSVTVPLMLMGLTLLTETNIEFISRDEIFEERNERYPHFHCGVDDYLQYGPLAGSLLLGALGKPGAHTFRDQARLMVRSELILAAFVLPLKRISGVPRPDTGVRNSFPSGHTAQAFLAASLLHKEYGDQNVMYSVLGFGTATLVGVLRVMNNRHWTSDVLFGAGLGVLSVNLAYWLDNIGTLSRRSPLIAVPMYANRTVGICVIISMDSMKRG